MEEFKFGLNSSFFGYRLRLLLFLMIISLSTQAQTVKKSEKKTKIYVPFKVKDKFGIANEQGAMVLPPVYDFVSVNYTPNLFTAFNYSENQKYKTSLIREDKVLLKDQHYFGYYQYNDVIIAAANMPGYGSGYYSLGDESMTLYTIDGKKIVDEVFRYAGVFVEFDKSNTLSHTLIQLIHQDGTHSIVLYDKKTRKITTKFVDRAKDVDFEGLDMLYHTQAFTVKIVDAQNIGREMEIKLKDKVFQKTFERTFEVNPKKVHDYYQFSDVHIPEPPFDDDVVNPIVKFSNEEQSIKKYELRTDYKGYQPPSLHFSIKKLNLKYQKMIFEGNKVGLYNTRDQKVIYPAIYDDLYDVSFRGHHLSGYVFKLNGKYGIKMATLRDFHEIDAVFDYLPYVLFYQYGSPDLHLIGLYDEAGNFLYYANQEGKIYSKE